MPEGINPQDAAAFIAAINKIKKTCQSARFLFEFGDWDSSGVVARRAESMLNELASQTITRFPDLVSVLEKIKSSSSDIEATPASSQSEIYLLSLQKINERVSNLEKTGREVYRMPDQWTDTLLVVKKAAIGLGALALVFGIWKLSIGVWQRNQGLRGEYFRDKELAGFVRHRIDKTIDFDWQHGAPFKNFQTDGFSVRWTGSLIVPKSGNVEFMTESDDGVRLWINDEKIIDNWSPRSLIVERASIHLEAGRHRVRLEYFEDQLEAVIRLKWKRDDMQNFEVISSKYFSS
jgi:hypothetical protein